MTEALKIYENHPIHIAGRVWVFSKVTYFVEENVKLSLSLAELTRMQNAVANTICAEEANLTKDEYDFLCEMTWVSNKEIMEVISCSAPGIAKWRKNGFPSLESRVLKEFFWLKLFGDKEQIKNNPEIITAFTQTGIRKLSTLGLLAVKTGVVDAVDGKAA